MIRLKAGREMLSRKIAPSEFQRELARVNPDKEFDNKSIVPSRQVLRNAKKEATKEVLDKYGLNDAPNSLENLKMAAKYCYETDETRRKCLKIDATICVGFVHGFSIASDSHFSVNLFSYNQLWAYRYAVSGGKAVVNIDGSGGGFTQAIGDKPQFHLFMLNTKFLVADQAPELLDQPQVC